MLQRSPSDDSKHSATGPVWAEELRRRPRNMEIPLVSIFLRIRGFRAPVSQRDISREGGEGDTSPMRKIQWKSCTHLFIAEEVLLDYSDVGKGF